MAQVKIWNIQIPEVIESYFFEDDIYAQDIANKCEKDWNFGDIVYFLSTDSQTKLVTFVDSDLKLIPFDKIDQGGDETLRIPLYITKSIPINSFQDIFENNNPDDNIIDYIDFVFDVKKFEDFKKRYGFQIKSFKPDDIFLVRFNTLNERFVPSTIYIFSDDYVVEIGIYDKTIYSVNIIPKLRWVSKTELLKF